MKSGVRGS